MSAQAAEFTYPFGAASKTQALAPARERLTTTLFLAALFHGVIILGVTFGAPESLFRRAPSLDVILLAEEKAEDGLNPEAAYLSQRNQKGSGTTEEVVPPASAAASPLPAYMLGIADGNGIDWQQAIMGNPSIDVVTSRAKRSDPFNEHGEIKTAQMSETPLALFYAPTSPIIDASIDKALTLRGPIDHEVEVAPNTREALVAPYLDGWRRKVERLGTLKYPLAARSRDQSRNPVLEVLIRADGTLEQIVVRRSSGYKDLDQAAIGILRLASPFDSFPATMHQSYDHLRFAYEWQFIGERLVGSISLTP